MRNTYAFKLTGFLFLVLLISVIGGGCNLFEVREGLASPAESVDERVVQANNSLGLNLFHQLLQAEPGENIFISPSSVAMALAMTYNGAQGETSQAMAQALLLEGMSLEEINKAFADLKTILQNPDPEVLLAIANSLWAREGVAFNEDFLARTSDYFGAEVTALSFDDPEAADMINRWVKEQTRNKIAQIVEPPINPETILFLINAIYFKGEWSVPFDPQHTRDLPFYRADGTQKQHPMMFRGGNFDYLDHEQFQAISLPYGENERVSMYIFLPAEGTTLDDFHSSLNVESWNLWMNSFEEKAGEITLPRFKFEYESSLNTALKALGMGIAFDEAAADFSGMRPIPPNLFISNVKHKTIIEVNEEGTEAAAVTSVEIGITSVPELFQMTVDQPFFFAIVDNMTGIILFMGSVEEPL